MYKRYQNQRNNHSLNQRNNHLVCVMVIHPKFGTLSPKSHRPTGSHIVSPVTCLYSMYGCKNPRNHLIRKQYYGWFNSCYTLSDNTRRRRHENVFVSICLLLANTLTRKQRGRRDRTECSKGTSRRKSKLQVTEKKVWERWLIMFFPGL